jgi:hypothetical protein
MIEEALSSVDVVVSEIPSYIGMTRSNSSNFMDL